MSTVREITSSALPASSLTTQPVEWLRVPEAARRFSLSRSTLYLLIAEGKIKSCCIRRKGSDRGARRISAESLSVYMHSLVE